MNTLFINAKFPDGAFGSLRVQGSRIAELNGAPENSDRVVDLKGDLLLPGLINAHDHLQLNSLPSHGSPQPYRHARDWVTEVDARRREDPQFEAGVAIARNERLFLGGIKNLLSGVTTVAHHDPLYPLLSHRDYPIAVVQNFGWSHSLYIDGDHQVAESYRSTPAAWPWVIHAAEGVDVEAAHEFARLEMLGCIRSNTLLVHGIALDGAQRARLVAAASGLIWCPSSNLFLFGKTARVLGLIAHHRVALGTDSRLSGARDLLDELKLASQLTALDEATLRSLVTTTSAALLRLPDRGALRPGLRADLLVLPAAAKLGRADRTDVRLLMIGGIIRYGDRECVIRSDLGRTWSYVRVDGVVKVLDRRIVERLSRTQAREPGLQLADATWRAA